MSRCGSSPRSALLGLLLLLFAAPGTAHQYWLSPSQYSPAQKELVDVGACSGTGFRGEAKPWAPERCVSFSFFTYRPFSLAEMAPSGSTMWARQTFADGGGTWLQYQSNHAFVELPADEFDAYLSEEGLSGPLTERQRSPHPGVVRERYRRCAKAWFRGADARRASRPLGQPLELVPLSRPGESATLRVRVLWQGRPLSGAIVKTWRQPLAADGHTRALADRDSVAQVEQARSDARGEVRLGVVEPGEWLVSTVHMVPSPDPTLADWESTWASLTFARRTGPAPVRVWRRR